jgi:pimeloyl-ACP methyl ester carboxylesterase
MAEMADDAAALLHALDLAPAVVVGHSGGASMACGLVARHPQVVRHAVLFEPPLLAVVPQGQQMVAGMRAVIEPAMAEGGPRHAMEAFIRGNAGDEVADQWFESLDPTGRDRILDNGAVFFPIELPAFAAFVPDREGHTGQRGGADRGGGRGEPRHLVRGRGGLAGRGDRGRARRAARWPRRIRQPPAGVPCAGAPHRPLRSCAEGRAPGIGRSQLDWARMRA